MEFAPLDDLRVLNGETPVLAHKGRRLIAFFIDAVLGYAVGLMFIIPLIFLTKTGFFADNAEAEAVYSIFLLAGICVYFSYMESSPRQATWGKYWLGMQVCDTDYTRLTFGKAFIRNIGKIGCFFTCYIGFLVIFFTKKSQTLADIIASALVIKR